jgi:hypothetical protein
VGVVKSVAEAMTRVALISVDGQAQRELAGYLAKVGFEVHEYDDVPVPTPFAALVLIGDAVDAIVACARTWLKLARIQSVIVVTAKPAALRELVAVHGERLCVLAEPAFGWDVVDAIRASGRPTRPSGA